VTSMPAAVNFLRWGFIYLFVVCLLDFWPGIRPYY